MLQQRKYVMLNGFITSQGHALSLLHAFRPGTDRLSKAVVRHPKVIDILATTLSIAALKAFGERELRLITVQYISERRALP
ncbi:hypothetical protein VTP01DRAFT_857 [Rhizomucor pusillus]|uniref:uncharacterized protein n=1 Tax=Rhizomucor pusillus TaxID=4840 RepID=UPI0037429F39